MANLCLTVCIPNCHVRKKHSECVHIHIGFQIKYCIFFEIFQGNQSFCTQCICVFVLNLISDRSALMTNYIAFHKMFYPFINYYCFAWTNFLTFFGKTMFLVL